MLTYDIPLVPGPTRVPESVRRAYLTDYGSADLEPEYARLYREVQDRLRTILGTHARIAIMTGEGMIALWGALKSCIRPGDRVLAVSTGVFGHGIGEMAAGIGAEVRWVEFGYDDVADPGPVEEAIRGFDPKMVTAVHCETPSGTLNPVGPIGELVRRHGVPLYYVDAVASAGGTPVRADEWSIDLCLFGTQKALSAFPDLAGIAVSDRAWDVVAEVDYGGYDALLPYRDALEEGVFPYTPDWAGLAALGEACRLVLDAGLEDVYARHEDAASRCRERAREMGLSLHPVSEAASSPTVTALRVPDGTTWEALDRGLREHGMAVGGSLGPLAGKVFRIGHMGAQADRDLVERGMGVLERVLPG
ncbi:MAG: aminotransferase class V-fold PLP-dependent enzyme [Gemmatimonadetes bacterium]|nr:alanine--glyoxylate aminotransferase family protein [Gemmatimonadota bacterium]NIR80841.1 alanine--glyoxylate aminotransferase family protein [Gemmatimonadota bacterium]NIT89660.1 alanine--glyoxylate aminotransferase family protein [Gemmatimonadota bacterium]NIU33440.1 alanine--glyoxylate aminotransferase family protein [Gemmatimonadota bacterium]NIU37728.1 aminotransferase class V-fold PLP-dependent enzyme [Gemmatimonadota bacterium]